MEILLLLPLGTAFLCRMYNKIPARPRKWLLLIPWPLSLLTGFVVGWEWVVGVSVIGFLLPEIWEALKAFIKKPKNILITLGLGIVAYALFVDQSAIAPLLSIGILLVALRFMLGGFKFGKRKSH